MSFDLLAAMRDRATQQSEKQGYLKDPMLWCRKVRGVRPWSKQKEIMESVRDNTRTAVQSCHGIGKSFIAANAALWWIDSHPPGTAIVVSTAPTYQQVHAILWEEIRKGHREAKLMGTVSLSDEWKDANGDIVGFGRKPADQDEHGFQGIHREFVLVIADEGCGIPAQLFTAMEAIVTNADCRILVIGNPDDPNTEFGKVCKPGSGYNVISVSAFDTPNFTDEGVGERLSRLLVSKDWVEDKRKRWGEGSPLWVSKVLGQFPEISEDTLIHPAWVRAAQDRSLLPGQPARLGVDVARMGRDSTVLGLRRGGVYRTMQRVAVGSTVDTAGRVVAMQTKLWQEDGIVVDAHVDGVGVGGGVVDMLNSEGYPVVDMLAGGAPQDGKRFANARAEWYWQLRKMFEAGLIDLDPADDDLASQLCSIKFEFTSQLKIKIESKDDMEKRGMPSPDLADAMMLAYGDPRVERPTGSSFYNIG